jgi:hypothetical protein
MRFRRSTDRKRLSNSRWTAQLLIANQNFLKVTRYPLIEPRPEIGDVDILLTQIWPIIDTEPTVEKQCYRIMSQPADDNPSELGAAELATLSPRAIFFGIVFSLPLWGGIWYVLHVLW